MDRQDKETGKPVNARQVTDPQVVDVLTTVQRALARSLAEHFADEEVTVDQWRALSALASEPDGLSMGELGDQLQLPAASLTRLVDALVDGALVYRRPSDDDGRRVTVQVAALGRRKLSRLDAVATAQLDALEPRARRALVAARVALGEFCAAVGLDR